MLTPHSKTGCLALVVLMLAHAAPSAFAQAAQESQAPSFKDRRAARQLERQQSRADKADAAASAAIQAITTRGTHSFKLVHGGITRSYLVHVPRSYDAARPTPVVFAFHGGGGNMQFQAGENYGLVDKAEQAGFVAVFPNGYSKFPGGKLATWNAGHCCADARDKNIDDVGFVRVVLGQVKQQANVDAQRVFATGMSNGAMLSHRLACEMAAEFRAIAAVAGTDNTASCTPAQPISVLQIHARDDTHVLFNGGAGPDAFKDTTKVTDFTSVPETMARWAQRNHCEVPAQTVLQKPGALCEAYSGCADRALVQLCLTETGGHSWPGAQRVRAGKVPASQAISANDAMWEFFLRASAR